MSDERSQKEIYNEKRKMIMNEEEFNEANKIMMWYRAAWEDKDDRKIFQLYNLIEAYWEGESNQPQFIGDPASNTNIVHPNIETIVSLTVDKNIAVEVTGKSPSEQQYLKPIRAILEFIMEKSDIVTKMYSFTRRLAKFGTGVYRVIFDPTLLDYTGLPMIDEINPAYILIDPNIVDMRDIEDAEFIIEPRLKSIESARRRFGDDKANAICPGYDPMYNATVFGEEPGGSRELSRLYYIHFFVWFKEYEEVERSEADESGSVYVESELKMRLIEMSACGVTLSNSRDQEGEEKPYFPNEEYPYKFGTNYKREGCIWGKGDAELMLDPQEQLNDYDDQIRQYARLLGNPQRWLDPNSGCDPRKWTNEEGLILPVMGGSSSLGYISVGTMPPDLPMRRDRIMDIDIQKVTRINSQMMGQRQKGVDSATESLALKEAGNTVMEEKTETIKSTLVKALTYSLKLAIHYWDSDMMFAVTGDNSFMSFKPSLLANIPELVPVDSEYRNDFQDKHPGSKVPEYMEAVSTSGDPITRYIDIAIDIKMGTGTSKNKSFTYSVMKEAWREKVLKKSTYLKYLRDDIDVPIPQEEIDEAKMIEEIQLGQLQQAIQGQQPSESPKGGGGGGSTNQQQRTMTGVPEGESAGIPGLNEAGNPRRPQSPMKGEMDSNAK